MLQISSDENVLENPSKVSLGATVRETSVDFAIWLPDATAVTLILDNADFSSQEFAMAKRENDIWFANIPDAKIGMTYQFRAEFSNGETKIFNDPRARQLSSSSDGKSLIATDDFDWQNDANFVPEKPEKQIIYELHLGTFSRNDPATPGNFQTAREKFAYLKTLGVNMLEILPVTSMLGGAGWGYAPVNLFAVEENYGGPHALREFICDAHQNGFGVILDVVYNHIHPAANLPDAYFFARNDSPAIASEANESSENHENAMNNSSDPAFANPDNSTPNNSANSTNFRDTPWGPRFDYTRAEVQDFLTDNIAMWLRDFHADGLRLDFTLGIRQQDPSRDDFANGIPGGWEILQKINQIAKQVKPSSRLIAEDNGANDYLTKNLADGGAGFDSQWGVSFPRALRAVLQNTFAKNDDLHPESRDESPENFAKNNSPLTNNPDFANNFHLFLTEFSRTFNNNFLQKINFAESHDTAALSNGGQRLAKSFDPADPTSILAKQKTLLAAALVLTAPGTPMLFAGQEFLANSGWSAHDALDWDDTEKFASIVAAHRDLINLRKNAFANSGGLTENFFRELFRDENQGIFFFQHGEIQPVVIIANFSANPIANFKVPPSAEIFAKNSSAAVPSAPVETQDSNSAEKSLTENPKNNSRENLNWQIIFNSSWTGYSPDFANLPLTEINSAANFDLPPFCVLLLAKN